MNETKYIYVRKAKCEHCGHEDLESRQPIACVAYKDLGGDKFVYGLSILHPEDMGQNYTKKFARQAATNRLLSAMAGENRNCPFYGFVDAPKGGNLNTKIVAVLEAIRNHPSSRKHLRDNIPALQKRLLKSKIAEKAA